MADYIWQGLNYFAFFVLLLTIGCKVSPKCLYYTNVSIIYLGLVNFSIVLSVYGLFHKSYETSRLAKTLLDPVGKLLNIEYHVEGQELIDKNKAYIVIANHQHTLDMVSIMQASNKIVWSKNMNISTSIFLYVIYAVLLK